MYLNRIRPPKPKFVEEVTKAEFVPEEPVIKDYSLLPYAELKKMAIEKGFEGKSPKKSKLIEFLGGANGQD